MLERAELGSRIRKALADEGLTFQQVADEYGVTVQAVSGWVRTGKIDGKRLPKLAQITRKPLSFFMPDADGSVPSQSVRDDRQRITAIMRLIDNLHEVSIIPIPVEQHDAVAAAAVLAVDAIGSERIMDETGLEEARRHVAATLRGRPGAGNER